MALVKKNSAGQFQLSQAQYDALSTLSAGTSTADALVKILGKEAAKAAMIDHGFDADDAFDISKFIVVDSEDEDDGTTEFANQHVEPSLVGQFKLKVTRVRPGSKRSASPIVIIEGAAPDGENHAFAISANLAEMLDLEEGGMYSFELERRIPGKTTWISKDPGLIEKAQAALKLKQKPSECYIKHKHKSSIGLAVRRVLGEVTEPQWKDAVAAAQKALQLQNSTNIAVGAVSQLMQMFISLGMTPAEAATAATSIKITN